MGDSEIRQRKPKGEASSPTKSKSKKASASADDDGYTPWVDILRVLTFLFLVSCGASYVISGGESWFWGMKNKPHYLKAEWWRAKIVG